MKDLKVLISEHPFFRSLAPRYLGVLVECATVREFAPEEVIFREGAIADRFYLLQGGKVALETAVPPGGRLEVQQLGADDVLGWSWLFPPYVWHFQARALELTQAISFDGAHLLIACERDHEFGYDLMKRLTQILIRRLQASRRHVAKLHQVNPIDCQAKDATARGSSWDA